MRVYLCVFRFARHIDESTKHTHYTLLTLCLCFVCALILNRPNCKYCSVIRARVFCHVVNVKIKILNTCKLYYGPIKHTNTHTHTHRLTSLRLKPWSKSEKPWFMIKSINDDILILLHSARRIRFSIRLSLHYTRQSSVGMHCHYVGNIYR